MKQIKITIPCNSEEQKDTLSRLIRLIAAESGKNQADAVIEKLEQQS